jgi:hypothetical protein
MTAALPCHLAADRTSVEPDAGAFVDRNPVGARERLAV